MHRSTQISRPRADVYMYLRSCFQMNGLLALALEALGYKVVQLLCKVRWNKAPDEATTFTHVALRVTLPSGER
jgi:arylamine N-acetyltransferase